MDKAFKQVLDAAKKKKGSNPALEPQTRLAEIFTSDAHDPDMDHLHILVQSPRPSEYHRGVVSICLPGIHILSLQA